MSKYLREMYAALKLSSGYRIIDIEFVYSFIDGEQWTLWFLPGAAIRLRRNVIYFLWLSKNSTKQIVANGRKISVTFICPHDFTFPVIKACLSCLHLDQYQSLCAVSGIHYFFDV